MIGSFGAVDEGQRFRSVFASEDFQLVRHFVESLLPAQALPFS
jgi:hypothetical protein